jgi:hypothetical protein
MFENAANLRHGEAIDPLNNDTIAGPWVQHKNVDRQSWSLGLFLFLRGKTATHAMHGGVRKYPEELRLDTRVDTPIG